LTTNVVVNGALLALPRGEMLVPSALGALHPFTKGTMADHPDRRIDRLARRQYGAFNRRQCLSRGFTPRMIEYRLAAGAWVGLDRGVYALSSHPWTWERQAMGATLAVEGACLSGRSAAAWHEIEGFRRAALEITVPSKRKATTVLAAVRRSDFFESRRLRGIPCLTVPHTILSLVGQVPTSSLEAAIDDVVVRRLTSVSQLQDEYAQWAPRRRRGTGVLREILRNKGDGYTPPMTQLERMLRRLLACPDLPRFEWEHNLSWWPGGEGRVDAYAPECSLIVEADGRAWHTREREFVKDRRRDNLAVANGHVTLRFTWADLSGQIERCRELVRRAASVGRPMPG
jgi:very-short-patch-repair endonuclease